MTAACDLDRLKFNFLILIFNFFLTPPPPPPSQFFYYYHFIMTIFGTCSDKPILKEG
jgi:hypothetical protein